MLAPKISTTLAAIALSVVCSLANAQRGQTEGINDSYKAPELKVGEWVERFEGESREVFAQRHKIVAALGLEPGQRIADIGAGTGLFVPLLAEKVGKSGKVYAVDIAPPFIEYIDKRAREEGLTQVETVLSNERSIELPANSVDVIFTSDAYHHFVHYQDMLASMRTALKPGGELILLDFDIGATELDSTMVEHVGKTKEEFRRQVEESGFKLAEDLTLEEMKTNFMYRFVKK